MAKNEKGQTIITEAQTKARILLEDRQDAKVMNRELRAEEKPRTPLQQLAALDARLGKGVGAKKERRRLMARLP